MASLTGTRPKASGQPPHAVHGSAGRGKAIGIIDAVSADQALSRSLNRLSLSPPVSKAQLVEAFAEVEAYVSLDSVKGCLRQFLFCSPRLEPAAKDALQLVKSASSGTEFREIFRGLKFEVARDSGQGITKAELTDYLSHVYASGNYLGKFQGRRRLKDAVDAEHFARNKTAKIAHAIWEGQMTAAEAGALLGHTF